MAMKRSLQFGENALRIGGLPDRTEHGYTVKTEGATVWGVFRSDATERDNRGAALGGSAT